MSDEAVVHDMPVEGVLRLTINRENARNALSPAVVTALLTGLDEAETKKARAVIITGAGTRTFCAGGDLGAGGTMGNEDGVVGGHERRGHFAELLLKLSKLSCPSIAQVNGHALGGGLGLAAACDLGIATDNASFGTPEVRVGLFPMMIMAVVMRVVGRKRALELMLTGERIDAATAASYGLVNRVVPAEELETATLELASKVASFSPVTMRLGRKAFSVMADLPLEPALEYLNGMLSLNLMTEDAMEGIAAFIEKRPPEWKGR